MILYGIYIFTRFILIKIINNSIKKCLVQQINELLYGKTLNRTLKIKHELHSFCATFEPLPLTYTYT